MIPEVDEWVRRINVNSVLSVREYMWARHRGQDEYDRHGQRHGLCTIVQVSISIDSVKPGTDYLRAVDLEHNEGEDEHGDDPVIDLISERILKVHLDR